MGSGIVIAVVVAVSMAVIIAVGCRPVESSRASVGMSPRPGRCVLALEEQSLVTGQLTTPRATCMTDGAFIACNTGRLPYGPRV